MSHLSAPTLPPALSVDGQHISPCPLVSPSAVASGTPVLPAACDVLPTACAVLLVCSASRYMGVSGRY